MADSASEMDVESDTSSVEGMKDQQASNEQLLRRVESLHQENRVLKTEVDTLKLKIKGLNDLNQQLRRNSVNIQAKAEQEEEYISNTLLKKITELKKEKESLALNYEQEEECLTNELNRKFTQLRQEKVALERTLAREQEDQVSKLKLRIEKLETDMSNKQECLDRLRREKIELENALEQEQEALVNRLWKKMEKLETEKRVLQEKLESVGALLSGSSSNQSLASASHLSTSGNESMLVNTSAATPQRLNGVGGLTTSQNRPVSSGPGSLRSSQRLQHPPSSVLGNSIVSPSALVSGLGPLGKASSPNSIGVGPVLITDGGHRPQQQLNQSSSNLEDNQPLSRPGPTSELASCVNMIPPPSLMELDPLADHNLPNATSPGRAAAPSALTPSLQRPSGSDQPTTTVKTPTTDREASWNTHISAVYVNRLRDEVRYLRQMLEKYEADNATRMPQFECEEQSALEENRRLRKLLRLEKERREALSRQLSESESSLEMEDERQFNEACRNTRIRTTSDSTSPFHLSGHATWCNAPPVYGPGHAYAAALASNITSTGSSRVCRECGHRVHATPSTQTTNPSVHTQPAPPTPPHDLAGGVGAPRSLPDALQNALFSQYPRCTCSTSACASPSDSLMQPSCAVHQHHLHYYNRSGIQPNSPATPTTTSCAIVPGSSQAFAKPTARVPLVVSSSGDRVSRSHQDGSRDGRHRLSAGPDQLSSMDVPGGSTRMRPGTWSHQMQSIGLTNDDEDVDDDDDDARCLTPPLCQPDSTRPN